MSVFLIPGCYGDAYFEVDIGFAKQRNSKCCMEDKVDSGQLKDEADSRELDGDGQLS